jgi:multidrug resistance protein, MATE family
MTYTSRRSPLRTELYDSITLTLPLVGSQLAQAGTGFIDTVMMGWMGPQTLAAGGLAAAAFMTLFVAGLGLTTGVTSLAAEAFGAQDRSRVQTITAQGLWLTALVTIPAILLLLNSEQILLHLGQTPAIAQGASGYLRCVSVGYFPAIAFIMLRGVVSSLGAPRIAMAITVFGLLINAIGNYVLGFGKFGFPALELTGLAIATATAHWFNLLALIAYSYFQPKLHSFQLFSQITKPDRPILTQVFNLGLPTGIAFTAEVGLFSITTFLMGKLGVTVLAAHQIVFQTISLIFMVPLGIAYATTIRVGLWLGKEDWAGIQRATFVGIGLGAGFMTIMATILLAFPQWVMSLYLDLSNPVNQPLIPIVTALLAIAALAQILDGVQAATAGALRGLQDTKIPMVLSFIAFWGMGLTTGYFLGFQLGWGGVGLWLGQSIGITTASILFVRRFLQLGTMYRQRNLSEIPKRR